MTSDNHPKRTNRLGRTLGLGLGLGLALLANLGDRAFSASPANSGIDPLQILDTSVKNNVLFFVDTSGSMSATPENNLTVGGDDPASRFYQMKRAVRDVLAQNAGLANFGLATFAPDAREAEMTNSGLFYVSQDPSATVWQAYMTQLSTTFTNHDADTCLGAGGTCVGQPERSKIFRGLGQNGNYPATCTPQPAGNQVSNGGVANPPITHVFGTHCRYYMRSMLMRNGKRYVVTPGITNNNNDRRNTAVVSSSDITCPLPPPGLLGDDALAFADGTRARACFQIQNASNNEITTYWASSARFTYDNVGAAPGGDSCSSNGTVIDVSDCGVDNSAEILANMRMELQYDAAGNAQFLPPVTALAGQKPGITDTPYPLPNPPIRFNNVGIRQAFLTPLAGAMQFALGYFQNTILAAGGSAQRPLEAQGKQKNFVILLSDGDESCGGNPTQAARNLWNNTLPGLPAWQAGVQGVQGITEEDWSVANRIELLMITFAGGTATTQNNISKAGTGSNSSGVCQPLYPGFPGSPLAPCRNAFIATNLDELVNALNAAINTSTNTGTFSDQQSITETIYEFGANPLDPDRRHDVNVPILLQSTFDLPGYKGHLEAIGRDDNGTVNDLTDDISLSLWDAGQKLQDRVSDASTGMGPAPASPCTSLGTTGCYLFEDLYGNATNTTPTNVLGTSAKIKRRIFTTTQNGVNPNFTSANLLTRNANLAWTTVPLWPPTTCAGTLACVAPTATTSAGILDAAIGLNGLTTVAEVQALIPGACQGTVPGNIHLECTSGTAGVPLARAKREAREIILAHIAGAEVQTQNGIPVRTGTTGAAAGRQQLMYAVRPWIMAESTLAGPGVVTPPLQAGPRSGELGFEEYKHYRDGLRTSTGAPVNSVLNGLGLRNPDRLVNATPSLRDAAANDTALKPVMSVVYHATNQGLHALRGGPCPTPPSGSGLFGTTLPCVGETGGEELWAFVPFDQLKKLAALTKAQSRNNKQYLLASPVRFSDVFVPGNFNSTSAAGTTPFTGVWRTLLYFGRGQGGQHYTALDITVPGPFTRHSLETEPPIVVWNRGNPDTTTGVAVGPFNNTATDLAAYAKMGETWSVPSLSAVNATDYTTPRTGASGANFVLFTGSGYSDVVTEGKTFYVLDALSGDVIRSFDIPSGSPVSPESTLTNFLVASPVSIAVDANGDSPSGFQFFGNPITVKAKTVYFGDIHGRIWRYDATAPATPPVAFFTAPAADGNQPFSTAVSVLFDRPDPSLPGDILLYAESGFDRRVAPQASKPFKAYAFKDLDGVRTDLFERDFEADYRGVTQPATAFAGATLPPAPVVFFAGLKFTDDCVSAFDSILIALRGIPTVLGAAEAAFDLRATGDDAVIHLEGQKINAISVNEGGLVVDTGLGAEVLPPPPGVLQTPPSQIDPDTSTFSVGLVPGSKAYTELSATTVPYRVGSSVCTVN